MLEYFLRKMVFMKKILIILILILLTGCGNKKNLVCTKNSDLGKQTMTFKYNKNGLKEGQIKYIISVNEEDIIDAKEEIEASFKENFPSFNIRVEDNSKDAIIVMLEFDKSNINNIFGSNINSDSYNDLKNRLEKEDFICN